MRSLRAWWMRLLGLGTAAKRAHAFDAELESHLELHIEDNIRRGMAPEEARRHALIAMGGAHVRDAYRDRGGLPLVDTIGHDVRFAVRMLRKAPGFTTTALLVLALGVGANAAVFSLINAVLLKPVNAISPRLELFGLYSGDRTRPDVFRPFSYPEFVDLRSRNDVFDHLFAESLARAALTEGGLTRRVTATYVSSNYFSAFGASPAMGRFFTPDEERPGNGATVAVVSDGYWRRHGMPADIVGRTLTVNARPLTIVGVAPEGFRGSMAMLSGEFWLPLGAASVVAAGSEVERAPISNDRASFSVMLSGTLKPGTSVEEAHARLAPLADAFAAAYPATNANQRLVVQRRSRLNFGLPPPTDAEPMLGAAVLMVLSGMVLVVACLNLANLQLARGSARRQEIAVRLAMGGSRLRIIRQLLVEGLLLSIVAGTIGLAIAWFSADRITRSMAALLERSVEVDVRPDARVLTMIGIACIVSALVFALGPALKLSRADLTTMMKQAGPLPPMRRRRVSVPGVLVGAQVALSLALLAAAGVFVRASITAAASDPGFALDGGVMVDIDPAVARMDEAATRRLYARIHERLRTLPDVHSVSAGSIVPFGNMRDGRIVRTHDVSEPATFTSIGSGYFQTLGLPIIVGREFTPVEEARVTEPVAIIDEMLAERLFPQRNPVGEFVELVRGDALDGPPLRIVGIVPSVRDDVLGARSPHVYVPYGRYFRSAMTLHLRTTPGAEPAVMAAVRDAIQGVDPQTPVLAIRPFSALRDGSPSLWGVRIVATLFMAFGLIGAVLSAAGIYGLRAYLVAQRTRELGIRIALGATGRGIVRALLKEGAVTAAFGLGAGLVLAVALVRVLRVSGMLDQVSAFDPLVMTLAPVVLAVAVIAASYIPARRVLRIDPAAALRPE